MPERPPIENHVLLRVPRWLGRPAYITMLCAGWLHLAVLSMWLLPVREARADEPATKSDTAEEKPAELHAPQPAAGQAEAHDLPIVEKFNIQYYNGPDADASKHSLDLFYPRDVKNFPVVLFIHGGAWMIGDKNDFGIYSAIGRMLARHGIGVAMINYRLSPKVKHPEHVKDIARAFAWVHKHIAEYGGRPDQMFVSGHSAGGHLSALLATDETWLRTEGLSLKDVRGAAPISGAYVLPPGRMLKEVFGTDTDERRDASPIEHVHRGCPPFLVIWGDHDFPTCGMVSESFARKLKASGVPVETLEIPSRNHIDILVKFARNDDPVAEAVRSFVFAHLK